MSINLRGEGPYFPPVIVTKKPIDKNMTFIELYNMITKSFKKILPIDCSPCMYVILPDMCCGFIPLPNQKLEELYLLYGENNSLTIKVTDRVYYG
jgi:hypothetical protein